MTLTEQFPLCSMEINLFTHWDSFCVFNSIIPYWWFTLLYHQFSSLSNIQRVSFACYLHPVCMRDTHGYQCMYILFVIFLLNNPALLCTSCWLMGDTLIPSFQWIPFHRLLIIYFGIGIQSKLSSLRLVVISGISSFHRQFWEYINVLWLMVSFKCSTSTHIFTLVILYSVR